MKPKYIEVWIDSASLEYVLILKSSVDGTYEIIDPQEEKRVIQVFTTYEEAALWLREDEYDLVEGRYTSE